MQLTVYSQTVEDPDEEICEKFMAELKASPQKLMDKMNNDESSPFSGLKGLKKMQKELEEERDKLKEEIKKDEAKKEEL